MMTARVFLSDFRVSFFVMLIVGIHGYPQKGSQSSTGQSGSGAAAASNYASYQGGAPSFASAPYSNVGGAYGAPSVPTFVQGPVYQPVLVTPGVSGSGSSAALGMEAAGVSPMAQLDVQAAGVSPVAQMGQAGAVMAGVPAYVTPQVYAPVEEYDAGTQYEQPETQWIIPPTVFEDESADTLAVNEIIPPVLPAQQGPTLQSGEATSLIKEAELGNYQQQTEEFGYPADLGEPGQGFGQGLGTVLVPGVQLGGFRPVSAGKFDRMLLYGMYPPGSYSTFSQSHEAGKDFSQATHYLKEHVTDDEDSGQQKFFQGSH